MKSISVVICAYNEARNLKAVLEETLGVLTSMPSDFEVIVVDDGSRDGTLDVARSFGAHDERVRIVVHAHNQGIGSALWDGYRIADKELVTFLPADGQISAGDIKLLADNIEGHDMVVSYYMQRPQSRLRQLTSKGARAVLFVLFGPMPRYEGTYMFRRTMLETIHLKMRQSFVLNYEMVIRAKRQGFKIKEIPTRCLERASGASKVLGFKKILFVLGQILQLRFKHF